MYQYPYQNNNQVVHVTGENGARAYQMFPNSSVLLLDETAPIVWLCQTDGAGYKTVTPYKIEPYKPEPLPDLNSLVDRINKLEEKINESYSANVDKQSNKQSAKSNN